MSYIVRTTDPPVVDVTAKGEGNARQHALSASISNNQTLGGQNVFEE